MAFRRGFKTWCENVSLQKRKALGLKGFDPLDPFLLADHLGARVLKATEVPGVPADALKILTKEDPESWSAITLTLNDKHLIVVNPTHSKGRTGSNLMHELSHILIGHKASRVDIAEGGLLMLRYCDRDHEAEADWLASCLLLPREALLHIRRIKMADAEATAKYHSSQKMLTYRLKMTGVDIQSKRSQAWR